MPSIKKNFFYSSILTSANYIFPLLVYPYVSRVLGVTKIGACNFVDGIITYFILFAMFGIGFVGIREIAKAKKNKEKLNEVYSNLFALNALLTSISVAVLLVVIFVVPSLVPYRKLLFIGVLKLVSTFFLMEWFFKGMEEFQYITLRTLIVKTLYVVSVFLFVREESNYILYYLLTVLMITVNSILNKTYSRRFVKFSFKNIKIWTFLAPAVIMGFYEIMTSMYNTFNTVFLGFAAGDEEVGYFSTSRLFFQALLAFFTAFTGVMLPRMSSLLAEGKFERFKTLLGKSANVLFSFSFPFVFLFVVYAPELITLYAGPGYEGAILPMQIGVPLMIVIGYEQIIINQALLPLDKNKAVLINSIIGATTGVMMSFVLVAKFKSVGSSIVWGLSELSVLISASIFLYKYIKFRFPIELLLKELGCYMPLLIILILVHNIEMNPIVSIAISCIITGSYTFVLQYYLIKQEDLVNSVNKFFPTQKQLR